MCESLYAQGAAAVTGARLLLRPPGKIVPGERCNEQAGVAVERPGVPGTATSPYPAEFDGSLFFADAVRRCIWRMRHHFGSPTRRRSASSPGPPGPSSTCSSGRAASSGTPTSTGARSSGSATRPTNHPPEPVLTRQPDLRRPAADGDLRRQRLAPTRTRATSVTFAWDTDGDGAFDDATGPVLDADAHDRGDQGRAGQGDRPGRLCRDGQHLGHGRHADASGAGDRRRRPTARSPGRRHAAVVRRHRHQPRRQPRCRPRPCGGGPTCSTARPQCHRHAGDLQPGPAWRRAASPCPTTSTPRPSSWC